MVSFSRANGGGGPTEYGEDFKLMDDEARFTSAVSCSLQRKHLNLFS